MSGFEEMDSFHPTSFINPRENPIPIKERRVGLWKAGRKVEKRDSVFSFLFYFSFFLFLSRGNCPDRWKVSSKFKRTLDLDFIPDFIHSNIVNPPTNVTWITIIRRNKKKKERNEFRIKIQ